MPPDSVAARRLGIRQGMPSRSCSRRIIGSVSCAPAQYLGQSAPNSAANQGLQVSAGKAAMLDRKADRLHRIRSFNRMMLPFPRLNKGRQHVQGRSPCGVLGAGIHEPFNFLKGALRWCAFRFNGLLIHGYTVVTSI